MTFTMGAGTPQGRAGLPGCPGSRAARDKMRVSVLVSWAPVGFT